MEFRGKAGDFMKPAAGAHPAAVNVCKWKRREEWAR